MNLFCCYQEDLHSQFLWLLFCASCPVQLGPSIKLIKFRCTWILFFVSFDCALFNVKNVFTTGIGRLDFFNNNVKCTKNSCCLSCFKAFCAKPNMSSYSRVSEPPKFWCTLFKSAWTLKKRGWKSPAWCFLNFHPPPPTRITWRAIDALWPISCIGYASYQLAQLSTLVDMEQQMLGSKVHTTMRSALRQKFLLNSLQELLPCSVPMTVPFTQKHMYHRLQMQLPELGMLFANEQGQGS